MSDLVERLRQLAQLHPFCSEAADEIERLQGRVEMLIHQGDLGAKEYQKEIEKLRAENERLTNALHLVIATAEDYTMLLHGQQRSRAILEMQRMARKALDHDGHS